MLKTLFVSFLLSASFVPIANAQSSVGGVSLKQLSELCRGGAMMGAQGGNVASRNYIDTTLKGRYAMGNSTMEQYAAQKKWMQSNCPAY